MQDDLVDFEVKLIKETEDAYYVRYDNVVEPYILVPKSQSKLYGNLFPESGSRIYDDLLSSLNYRLLVVRREFAKEKGMLLCALEI